MAGTFLSGPGLERDFAAMTGNKRSASEIAQQAHDGDKPAETILSRYEDRLARSLASIINVLDPDVIVLGGGVSKIDRLFSWDGATLESRRSSMLKMYVKAQNAWKNIRKGRFLRDEDGATAIEYGLIAAGIAIAIVLIVFAVGDSLANLFLTIQTWLDSAGQRGG